MAADVAYKDYIVGEVLREIDGVSARAMFGGWGTTILLTRMRWIEQTACDLLLSLFRHQLIALIRIDC